MLTMSAGSDGCAITLVSFPVCACKPCCWRSMSAFSKRKSALSCMADFSLPSHACSLALQYRLVAVTEARNSCHAYSFLEAFKRDAARGCKDIDRRPCGRPAVKLFVEFPTGQRHFSLMVRHLGIKWFSRWHGSCCSETTYASVKQVSTWLCQAPS